MRKWIAFLIAAMALAPGTVNATIYKCVSEDGVTRFSDSPCSTTAEVFIKDERMSIDEAVAQASPMADLTLSTPDIGAKLESHAKRFGKALFPSELLQTSKWSRYELPGRYPKWEVKLYYGKKGKGYKWAVHIAYGVRDKDDVLRIWLHTVNVRLTGTNFDPPSMTSAAKIKNLERIKTGQYRVPWWIPKK